MRDPGLCLLALAGGLALWNLALYPLLLVFLARRSPRGEFPARGGAIPTASVLLAAHDEEAGIASRIENLQAQEGVIEILVASDGSTDRTDEILRDLATSDARVRFFPRPRAGKVAALRFLARQARGEALVLTDANTRFEPGTVRALAAALQDAATGAACGDLRLEAASMAGEGEATYWSYETWIKKNASRAGLLLMGAGGVYAVRRADWIRIDETLPIPPDYADDSYVPLFLAIQGLRNRWVPEAVAWEKTGSSLAGEFRRRIRMVEQDSRLASRLPLARNPKVLFAFVSQKFLRWLLFPLGLLASVGVLMMGGWPFLLFLSLGLAFEAVLIRPAVGVYLLSATLAAFLGFLRGLRGRSRAVWDRAEGAR